MEIRFFMIFTQIRKRKMIQIKGIQDYFSLKERPEQKRHVKTWQEQLLFCMNIKKRLSDVYSTYVIDALSDGRQRSPSMNRNDHVFLIYLSAYDESKVDKKYK